MEGKSVTPYRMEKLVLEGLQIAKALAIPRVKATGRMEDPEFKREVLSQLIRLTNALSVNQPGGLVYDSATRQTLDLEAFQLRAEEAWTSLTVSKVS